MTQNKKSTDSPRKLSTILLKIVLLLAISVSLYIGYIFTQVNEYKNIFAANIYINETSIGGLTYDEAKEKIEQQWITPFLEQTVTLTASTNPTPLELNYESLGVSYNLIELLDEASTKSHDGNIFVRYNRYKKGISTPLHLTLMPSVDEISLQNTLEQHQEYFYQAPIDATMKRINRSFSFTTEKIGYKLDLSKLSADLKGSLIQNTPLEISVPLLPVEPNYTVNYLKNLQTPLASFYTSFNNSDALRNENIRVAAKKINTLLLPDEYFKFSNQLEPINEASGYKHAKVIANGEFVDGLGGGICQVSSTLYNAIIQTDLDIYMRRNHSLPVSYTPLGLDATYATNSVDFQFINNSGHPLYIESYVENNKVYVNLFGHKDFKPDYDAKFESVITEELPPGEPKYEDDPTLPLGKEIYKSYPKIGYKVTTYKHYYKDGKFVKKEKLNTSTYKPQVARIRRGTLVANTATTNNSTNEN